MPDFAKAACSCGLIPEEVNRESSSRVKDEERNHKANDSYNYTTR
jgi:hypothetical protein